MFKQILFVQWRSSRLLLLPLVLAAFGLPLLSVQGWGGIAGDGANRYAVGYLLSTMRVWLPLYPALAFVVGTALALAGWSWDHRVGHVHALSVPLPRWAYALLKMGAGAVLLAVPVVALWVGSLTAVASVDLPSGLHAYATALAIRFLLASLLSYALLFALAAGTMRTTIIVLTSLVFTFLVGEWGVSLAAQFVPSLEHWSLTEWLLRRFMSWPGPARVFSGSWMLIDV